MDLNSGTIKNDIIYNFNQAYQNTKLLSSFIQCDINIGCLGIGFFNRKNKEVKRKKRQSRYYWISDFAYKI